MRGVRRSRPGRASVTDASAAECGLCASRYGGDTISEAGVEQARLGQVAADVPATAPHMGGDDAAGIARAIALWRSADLAVAPIVGQRGALAVLRRSLSLNRSAFDWLPTPEDAEDLEGAIAALREAFALRQPAEADAAAGALSTTFGALLSALVGPALAIRLVGDPALAGVAGQSTPGGRSERGAASPPRRDRVRHAPGRRPQRGGDLQQDLLIAEKSRTLFRLDARIAAARAELARPHDPGAQGERRAVRRHEARLVQANEHLVLSAIDVVAVPPPPDPSDLRDANEHLVLAVLGAQGLQGQAEEIHRRQVMFLSMVAHELRNPLNPIRIAADLLQHASMTDELLARVQVILRRQVTQLTRLVDDLLDGARASTGKLRLECSTVSLRDVLDPVIVAIRPAMDERQQTLKSRLPQAALAVHADPVRLTQVFTNLLDNASKYSARGGEIGLDLSGDGGVATLCVTDTGIGITAEALPRIFDLFVQEIHARAHNGQGLGIGLAIVRELVESHGGTIRAASAGRGCGSRFVVTLPLLPEPSGPAAA